MSLVSLFLAFLLIFLQIRLTKFSGGLDEEDFLLLEEWTQKDGVEKGPKKAGSGESLFFDEKLLAIGPQKGNSAMDLVAFWAHD